VLSQIKTGPAAADHLQALTSYDLRALTFGRSAFVPLEGLNVHVTRGGYTGEDGFEVSLNPIALFRFPRAHGSKLQPWALITC
jgi:glycine cleavage system aminomethyltransferase T